MESHKPEPYAQEAGSRPQSPDQGRVIPAPPVRPQPVRPQPVRARAVPTTAVPAPPVLPPLRRRHESKRMGAFGLVVSGLGILGVVSVAFLVALSMYGSATEPAKAQTGPGSDAVGALEAAEGEKTPRVTLPDPADSDSAAEIPVATLGDPPEPRSIQELCTPEEIGEETGPVVAAYEVANGQLGEICLGEVSQVVLDSWDALAEFAPPEELDSIRLFIGFSPDAGSDTVAYTYSLDNWSYERFAIGVNLKAANADPDELRLTMAHELSHVFVQQADQLDLDVLRRDCGTYYNGFGCFRSDSYMAAWVNEFWTPEQIESLPRNGDIDEVAGDERCEIDASLIGYYGGSHPEEDFAESFSAYVFAVQVAEPVQARLDFFEAYPELVAFRDRAAAAGLEGLPGAFGQCG